MGITNVRRQHAIGQGFFHSAELLEHVRPQRRPRLRLRYVYDCGAVGRYAKRRSECIDAHLALARDPLDILFLSHAHADHVNGLPRLLDAKSGIRVDTIVLPLLDDLERLLAYARTASEDLASTADDFYADFVVDPVQALSGFGPRLILLVRSSGEGGGAPDPDVDVGPRGPELRVDGGEKGWKLVGGGEVRTDGTYPSAGSVGPIVATMPDTIGIAVPGRNQAAWLLAPYVDPMIGAQRRAFRTALLIEVNRTRPPFSIVQDADFDDWLADPINRRHLVIDHVDCLTSAYEAVAEDVNVTSMCLYSGPFSTGARRTRYLNGRFGRFSMTRGESIGWLATGDADLKDAQRRRAFLDHYRKLLPDVVTITIPHHGSERNFHRDILSVVDPCFCVVAADAVGKWRHPATSVTQAVASRGLFLSVVTSVEASTVQEKVWSS